MIADSVYLRGEQGASLLLALSKRLRVCLGTEGFVIVRMKRLKPSKINYILK